jgi:hypothetical protein
MSITLSPLSPVSSIYSASNNYPYVPTSLPINSSQDLVITSDFPLVFNKNRDNLTVAPVYPYIYPNTYPYTNPSVVVPYPNLNKDPDIINRLVKYFYYKTLDKWLYDDLSSLLRYIKISSKPSIIKNEDDRDKENISQEDADKKIKYIEDELFSKDDMYDILMKITNESNVELIKLPKNEFIVQGYVKKWFKREFQKLMSR